MPFIAFPEWLPDLPALGNPGCMVAKNVMPGTLGYRPFPGFSQYSTAALGARAQGGFFGIDRDGNVNAYAGDATKLYQLNDTSWADSSKSGGYTVAADHAWKFVQWGEEILATHLGDPIQGVSLGASTFADYVTSTLKPQARHMDIVRGQFLMLGFTQESGSDFPNRVRWSAVDDPKDFDQSQTTLSDFQDLRSSSGVGGAVQGIIGREYALIFQERAIWRAEFVGTPDIFLFNEVETDRGAWAANSIVSYGRRGFYLAEDGFYETDGAQSASISHEKVSRTFFSELDETCKHRITGVIDPVGKTVMWAYSTSASNGGNPDRILIYHWPTGRWSFAEIDIELLLRATSIGYTLDGLDAVSTDLDALGFSLDSRVWTGGSPLLAAFNTSHHVGFLNGTALDAVLETKELKNSVQNQRTWVSLARPIGAFHGATKVTVQPGARDTQTDSHTYSTTIHLNALGEAPMRFNKRYPRFRLNISGGFEHAQGVEVESKPGGRR